MPKDSRALFFINWPPDRQAHSLRGLPPSPSSTAKLLIDMAQHDELDTLLGDPRMTDKDFGDLYDALGGLVRSVW